MRACFGRGGVLVVLSQSFDTTLTGSNPTDGQKISANCTPSYETFDNSSRSSRFATHGEYK